MACTDNPTVNPASDFSATGTALDTDGTLLSGATVRLLRYFQPNSLFVPSVDDLFNCTSQDWRVCGSEELNFELALVDSTTTDENGDFRLDFTGQDIIAELGDTDAMGNQEGSFLVLVVLDPDDPQAGVFTYEATLSQANRQFSAGDLQLWDAGATVDVTNAIATGGVEFSWNALERGPGLGSDIYRVDVFGTGTPRLIYNCSDGGAGTGATPPPCDESGDTLSVTFSSFNIFFFYSNNGLFDAYVTGDGLNFRQRAAFTIGGQGQIPTVPRDQIDDVEIYAVSGASATEITDPAVNDDDPSTTVTLSPAADEIYVFVNGGLISDAGLLSAVVGNGAALGTCVVVELSTAAPPTIGEAQSIVQWTSAGQFCGGNAGFGDSISAIQTFGVTQTAGWIRFRVFGASTGISSVGEVAVYRP